MLRNLACTRTGMSIALCFALAAHVGADSVEVQDNPVPNGTITVAAGDADRSDWEGVPWFEMDDDFDEFYPVDIHRVQLAHDAAQLYVRVEALAWDVDEDWRMGLYIDSDEDRSTGYNGSFLAVGADYFVESGAIYEFTGAAQSDWAWNPVANLERDQSSMLDFELAIPLAVLGNPASFDFLLFANNFCCDFQLPDDVYPNGGTTLLGDFLSYELSAVTLPGDFDGNGTLDAGDIDDLTRQAASGVHSTAHDLDADGRVDERDIRTWIKQLRGSWIGDANLDGQFNSSDLVGVLAAGTYEADVEAVWSSGDFNGDGRANSTDLVAALADGGYEQGPAARMVPEPGAGMLMSVLGAAWLFGRRCGRRKASTSHRRRLVRG